MLFSRDRSTTAARSIWHERRVSCLIPTCRRKLTQACSLPHPRVTAWVEAQNDIQFHISVVSIGEVCDAAQRFIRRRKGPPRRLQL